MSVPDAELAVAWSRHVGGDRGRLDDLLARHREPHRRYHTAVHVMWVIRHVDELAANEPVEHHDEIVAAALYHDAVYDPRRGDNEAASAQLAASDLGALGWAPDRAGRVAAMIEATAHLAGTVRDTDGDTAILIDADLAILGSEPAAYDAYVTGVRAEYAHVDDAAWAAGRGQVLRGFLDRPAIFTTPTARGRWQQRSRANLAAELASLH